MTTPYAIGKLVSACPKWARITDLLRPSGYTVVRPVAVGDWADVSPGETGVAYEMNRLVPTVGEIVKVWPTAAGDWRYHTESCCDNCNGFDCTAVMRKLGPGDYAGITDGSCSTSPYYVPGSASTAVGADLVAHFFLNDGTYLGYDLLFWGGGFGGGPLPFWGPLPYPCDYHFGQSPYMWIFDGCQIYLSHGSSPSGEPPFQFSGIDNFSIGPPVEGGCSPLRLVWKGGSCPVDWLGIPPNLFAYGSIVITDSTTEPAPP